MIKRRRTRLVKVGSIKIGAKFPVRIQSMAKTDTRDTRKTIAEIKRLERAGCEIVRVAIKDIPASRAIKTIKKKIKIPLVADIHFDYRLALESIKSGADKIRINPGNISKPNELREIMKLAKKRNIPIRIGLNSGSLKKPVTSNQKPEKLFVNTALKYIKLFEKENFRDIIVSLKSSNVEETVSAYRKLAALCNYPFHLGITAAGHYDKGVIKSSIGIGALLLDGIGDTIRVSLTGDSLLEVIAAKRILQALQLRNFGPDIISCPTCGRCQVALVDIDKKIENSLRFTSHPSTALGTGDSRVMKPITLAIMGCEVNGPGEAREADIGIAFGKSSGLLFKRGKVVKKVKAKNAVKELLRCAGQKL